MERNSAKSPAQSLPLDVVAARRSGEAPETIYLNRAV